VLPATLATLRRSIEQAFRHLMVPVAWMEEDGMKLVIVFSLI
jgi:hypothetical protein